MPKAEVKKDPKERAQKVHQMPRQDGGNGADTTVKKRGAQQSLPGIPGKEEHTKKIPELHKAAEDYVEVRDRRQQLTPLEVEAKAKVLGLMKKHNLDTYKYEDIEVEVKTLEETVKVRKAKTDDE